MGFYGSGGGGGGASVGGAAAGIASSGLNPLSLIGIGGGLISGLLGRRKIPGANELSKKFGVGVLSQDTLRLYQMLSQSPAFRATLAQNSATGSQFANQLQGSLQARGLGTSGIGSVASAAGNQAISTGETALRGGLFGTAQGGAMQNLIARLQAFTQLQGQGMQQPSYMENFGASLLSGGASSLFGGR